MLEKHLYVSSVTTSATNTKLDPQTGSSCRGNAALCEFWLQQYSVCIYIMLSFKTLCGRVQRLMVKMLWLFKYLWTQLNYRVIMRSAHSLELVLGETKTAAVGKHRLYHLRWMCAAWKLDLPCSITTWQHALASRPNVTHGLFSCDKNCTFLWCISR